MPERRAILYEPSGNNRVAIVLIVMMLSEVEVGLA